MANRNMITVRDVNISHLSKARSSLDYGYTMAGVYKECFFTLFHATFLLIYSISLAIQAQASASARA